MIRARRDGSCGAAGPGLSAVFVSVHLGYGVGGWSRFAIAYGMPRKAVVLPVVSVAMPRTGPVVVFTSMDLVYDFAAQVGRFEQVFGHLSA